MCGCADSRDTSGRSNDSNYSDQSCCCGPGCLTSDYTTRHQVGNTVYVDHYQTAIFWDPLYAPHTSPDCCRCDGCGSCCWEVCCCAGLWRWLGRIQPEYPHNRAGGLVGYLMGSHPLRQTYRGGWDRLLGLRDTTDYRDREELMKGIRNSLRPEPSAPPAPQTPPSPVSTQSLRNGVTIVRRPL